MAYIIMSASSHVAAKARKYGIYRHVAVVEVDNGTTPKMISERAIGVKRIVWDSGSRCVGKTARSQYAISFAYAVELAEQMNQSVSREME